MNDKSNPLVNLSLAMLLHDATCPYCGESFTEKDALSAYWSEFKKAAIHETCYNKHERSHFEQLRKRK